jgi:precorrin-6Y C5,15-methyltransferase (decarboxylating)
MTVTVIGVDGATLPPGGAEALARASLVLGGERHLRSHAPPGTPTVVIGQLRSALDALDAHPGSSVVLASGDPGFFGILRSLRERGLRPVVLPAVSSVQRIAAAAGRPWDDVTVVSAHGREFRPALNVCRARPAVAVLTAPGAGPSELARGLAGWHRTLVVAEDLGGATESLSTVDLDSAAERSWRDPNIVLCLRDPDRVPARGWLAGGAPHPVGWALPEAEFAHRDGMVTKSEVRALVLARLAPRPGTLVWDLGSGSGSVAVECARFGAAVIAVDRDPAQCARTEANAAAHTVDVRIEHVDAESGVDLPVPDAVFVGGGGPGVVAAAARSGAGRVVAALAAVDRIAPTRAVLESAGYRVDGCQLSAARFADLPGGSTRLAAVNPVTVMWGMSGELS